MEDKSLSDKLIEGLQALYAKFESKAAIPSKEGKTETNSNLNELLMKREKEWKEKRIMANEKNLFLKIPRVVMLKHLLPYFETNEICRLCEVCICFNSLIKSTIFIHYFVSIHERTGISINLGGPVFTMTGSPKKNVRQNAQERSPKREIEERKESLQKSKIFLSSKLKESRENVKNLKDELRELKVEVEAEQEVKEKALSRATQLENEISEYKKKAYNNTVLYEENVRDLERDIVEKVKDTKKLRNQEKRLFTIEGKYIEENKKLEDVVLDLEQKHAKKADALKKLCDHFYNTTYPKLEGFMSRGDSNASRNEDLSIVQSLDPKHNTQHHSL